MLTRRLSLCLLELIDIPSDTDVSAIGKIMLAHVGADQRADITLAALACSSNDWNQDTTKGAAVS